METVKDRFSHYISDEKELEEFAQWAFGPYYRELDQTINFMETWNHLHSDLFKLEPDGIIEIDMPMIVQAWKDSNKS
jgi:hypothetical protein